MYHHFGCTLIYQLLSYPFRFLPILTSPFLVCYDFLTCDYYQIIRTAIIGNANFLIAILDFVSEGVCLSISNASKHISINI